MHYSILTGDELDTKLEFLTEDIRQKIRSRDGWIVIGQNDAGVIMTVAAFTFDPVQVDTVELAYIYTREEERENGWAMGSIYYAQERFEKQGIRRFICCPVGTDDELIEFTTFLGMANFEPVVLDWHVYKYELRKLKEAKVLSDFAAAGERSITKLSKEEVKYYLRSNRSSMTSRMKDNMLRDCDLKRSIFVVENSKIMGAILIKKDDSEMNITNLYIDPEWKSKQRILGMLAVAIKEMPESAEYLNLAVDNDNTLKLYDYVFGEPKEDCLVQCYERVFEKDDMEEA